MFQAPETDPEGQSTVLVAGIFPEVKRNLIFLHRLVKNQKRGVEALSTVLVPSGTLQAPQSLI